MRDNEPQPRPVARRGREGSSGGSSPLHAELDDVDPELRNALTADALAASPGSGPTAPAESVSAAAATTAAAAAAAATTAASPEQWSATKPTAELLPLPLTAPGAAGAGAPANGGAGYSAIAGRL